MFKHKRESVAKESIGQPRRGKGKGVIISQPRKGRTFVSDQIHHFIGDIPSSPAARGSSKQYVSSVRPLESRSGPNDSNPRLPLFRKQ